MAKKPKELVGKIYWLLLEYIHTEVPKATVNTHNTDWTANDRGDAGRIAIRTNRSINKLVKDGLEYAYVELGFSTKPQNPASATREITRFLASKGDENYSVVISRKDLSMPYIINISKSV